MQTLLRSSIAATTLLAALGGCASRPLPTRAAPFVALSPTPPELDQVVALGGFTGRIEEDKGCLVAAVRTNKVPLVFSAEITPVYRDGDLTAIAQRGVQYSLSGRIEFSGGEAKRPAVEAMGGSLPSACPDTVFHVQEIGT